MELLAGLLGTLFTSGMSAAMKRSAANPEPKPKPVPLELSPTGQEQASVGRSAGIRDAGGAAPGMADGMIRLEALRRLGGRGSMA